MVFANQHPAGYQDVWHFHQHVFPRFPGDNLYGGQKERYEAEERLYHAKLLREHMAE